jgi:hypothetical protein
VAVELGPDEIARRRGQRACAHQNAAWKRSHAAERKKRTRSQE